MCELIHLPRSPHYSRSLRSRLNHTPAPHTTEPPAPHAPRTTHSRLNYDRAPLMPHTVPTHHPRKRATRPAHALVLMHKVRLARPLSTVLTPVYALARTDVSFWHTRPLSLPGANKHNDHHQNAPALSHTTPPRTRPPHTPPAKGSRNTSTTAQSAPQLAPVLIMH